MSFLEVTSVLGNIGEFVGSIAVFATLIYLAVQVNQNKVLLERQTDALEQSMKIATGTAEAELYYRNVDWYRSILENPSVAELGVKLRNDTPLSDRETLQARAWASQLAQLWISSESYYANGLIKRSVFEDMLSAPEVVMTQYPGIVSVISDSFLRRRTDWTRDTEMQKNIRHALEKRGYQYPDSTAAPSPSEVRP